MSELNIKLGTALKEERVRQEISIEDLSERLKISIPNLKAIETGSTEGLPSELYFSLFAKSYAEALGIDYTRTVDAIKIDLNEFELNNDKSKNNDKKQNKQKSEEPEDENLFFKKAGITLAVIVGLFVIFLGVNKFFFNNDSSSETDTNSTDSEVQNDLNENLKIDSSYENYEWDDKEYDKPSKIVLTLIPQQESWSTILADGDTVIYRILRVGRTYQAEADYRLLVSVGIPSVVTIKLNGQEVDLRDSESRRISRVLINQMNIDSFLNQNQDSAKKESSKQDLTEEVKPAQTVVTTDDSSSVENSEINY